MGNGCTHTRETRHARNLHFSSLGWSEAYHCYRRTVSSLLRPNNRSVHPTMTHSFHSTASSLLLFLFLVLLVHLHPTVADPPCNTASCAPDHTAGCISCNASSAHCSTAWYGQPGYSCGTAVGTSSTGKVTYNAQCCPRNYGEHTYHCQAVRYNSVVGGVTYDVQGYSCVKDQNMSALVVVGIVLTAVAAFMSVLLLSCFLYRRRFLAAQTAFTGLSRLSDAGDEDELNGYEAPLMQQPQPPQPQPYSSQPYNLDMQPQPHYVPPPFTVQAQRAQPPSQHYNPL